MLKSNTEVHVRILKEIQGRLLSAMGGLHLSKYCVNRGHHTGLPIDNMKKKVNALLLYRRKEEEEEEHSWLA